MKSTLASLAGLLMMAACSQPLTVEQRIIHTIREMEAKIENGERRPFMEHIAEDFTAKNGRMTRDQVHALVVFQFKRFESIRGRLFPIEVIEAGPETAEARFRALLTGGPDWFPDAGQVYDFETSWRLEEGEWLLAAANWKPVDLEEVLENLPLPEPDP